MESQDLHQSHGGLAQGYRVTLNEVHMPQPGPHTKGRTTEIQDERPIRFPYGVAQTKYTPKQLLRHDTT